MVIYILRKIFTFLLILFLVAQISFSLVYFSPNSAFGHLPFIEAYILFFKQLFLGQFILSPEFVTFPEFTPSSNSDIPLFAVLQQYLPATFELCLLAIICSIIIGVPIGIVVGLSSSNWFNNFAKLTCLMINSCPLIWLAILIMYICSPDGFVLSNFDAEPTITRSSLLDITLAPSIDKYSSIMHELKHLALPVAILTIQPCIVTIQFISQSVAAVAKQNYIKVAIIREPSPLKIVIKHLLPNALPSVIPQLTYNITTLLFSTMLIEILFNRNGLGKWVFIAFTQHNYNVIAIAVLACGILISLLTLLSEIIAVMIYPMRYREYYE